MYSFGLQRHGRRRDGAETRHVGWLTRPACMSWAKMRPPLVCTAPVTGRQAATCRRCAGRGWTRLDWPCSLGCTPSLMIRPALARWAQYRAADAVGRPAAAARARVMGAMTMRLGRSRRAGR
ncbi:hypothetical protein GCM10027570_10170 [Streptomonospora sediminis]